MAKQRLTEIKVGVFVLVCLVVVAGLIIKFGKYTHGLQKSYQLVIVFPNVGGIVPDASVLYAGIPVGKVRGIRLNEDETLNVYVTLDIDEGVIIRQGAKFVINQSGLLGDRYIDVEPGSTKAAPLQPGEKVQGTTSVDLSEAIRGVVGVLKQTAGTIERIDAALRRADETVLSRASLDHVSNALANIDTTTSNAVQLTASMQGVVGENRERISNTLQRVAEASDNFRAAAKRADGLILRADGFIARADSLVATNQDDIHLAIQNLAASSARLNTILTRLEQGQGTVGKLLVDPALHDEILHLVDNWRRFGLLSKEGGPARTGEPSRGKTPIPARPAGQERNFGTDSIRPSR